MHRIPRIFSSDKKSPGAGAGGSDSNLRPKPRKRLERRNAMKNIDYGLPSTSSSSSSSEDYLSLSTSALDSPSPSGSAAQRRRSLDNFSLDKQTSFRIEGNCPGEFESICRSLGLTGPEDFSIPVEAWEDMKVRSPASDVLPRLSRFSYDGGSDAGDAVNRKIESPGVEDSACRVSDVVNFKAQSPESGFSPDSSPPPRANDVINRNIETSCSQALEAAASPARRRLETSSSHNADIGRGIRPLNNLRHSFGAVLDENEGKSDLVSNEQEGVEGIGCIRIKGVRPTPLAPPPAMSLPPIDRVCSTWDILKSFAPNDDGGDFSRSVVCEAVSSEDEENIKRDEIDREDVDEEEVHFVVANRRAGDLLSESCSFSSNDDDSSSTTTEPTSNNISPNGRFRRSITYWDKGELLGRGSFGSVYEGIADGGFFFAVKEVSLLDQGEGAQQSIYQLEQEIALLSQFEHENIVQYYGTDKDASKLYIFLELVTKGSLLSLYQKYNLRDSQVSAYTRQILHGLKYLHDRNVVHRDIKCANILVDASGSVKLADFGLAKATKLNDVKSCKGTALWMAPEVVNRRNQGYGLAADIWSLGCTVLEMLTRQFPYSHLESMQALFRIGKGEPPRVPESLSKDARDFILQCLQVNPNSRPTAAQLLDHPFVQRSISSSGCPSPYHPSRRV